MKITLLILSLLFLLQQCTNINLIPDFVSNESEFKYLSNTVSSENYEVKQISDKTYNFLTYDPINNYFILDDSYEIVKVNSLGEVTIKIPQPSGELPYSSHFVFTDSTVCDLSKDRFELEPYHRKINPATDKLEKEWISIFEEYYQEADQVLYGEKHIYLKIKAGWIQMRLPSSYFISGNNISERTFKNYPAKYNKLIFLKDLQSKTYSDWLSHSGSSIDRAHKDESLKLENYPEKRFTYSSEPIEKISFKKVRESSNYAYTPFIAQFKGIGYYKLKKGDETIYFKENAFKDPFQLFASDAYLNHYTLPIQFISKTEVSFIKYSFPTNQNESKSQGVYVVRRK